MKKLTLAVLVSSMAFTTATQANELGGKSYFGANYET